jgi:capsular polysaccharide biosynthesis protein
MAALSVRRVFNGRKSSRQGVPTMLRSPFVAVILHPLLVLVTCGVVTATSVDFVSDNPVLHTAEATLVVGRIDVPANAVPGYVQANTTLAGTYSRFVGSDAHLDEMAFLTDVEPADLLRLGTIEASNIEQSGVIRVRAESTDEQNAIQLADIASSALTRIVSGVNDPLIDGDELFSEHAEASASLASAQSDVDELQRDLAFFLNADPENELPGATTNAENAAATEELLLNARADFTQQQLRATTLASLYLESQRPRADGELIRVLTAADSVGSNRSAQVRLGLVTGILGGLALGVGLAWIATNFRALIAWRRELRNGLQSGPEDHQTMNGSDSNGATSNERSSYNNGAVNGTHPAGDDAAEHDVAAR